MRRKTSGNWKPRKNFGTKLFAIFLLSLGLIASLFAHSLGWDGESRYTIILQTGSTPLAIFSLEPETRQAIYITLPGNTQLDVPFGYKQFPASTVYKLGELDNKRGGGELLKRSIEATFTIAVDSYYVSSRAGLLAIASTSAQLSEIKSRHFSFSGLISYLLSPWENFSPVATNITRLERIRLWNSIRKLRTDQIKFINLLDTNIFIDERQPDGIVMKKIDKDILNILLAENFQDSKIRLENVTLEIVNATSEQRLASQFSEILTNMGANVIAKSNSKSKQSGVCYFYIKDKSYAKKTIINKIQSLYGCKMIENKISESTADIVIILGEDFLT